MLRRSFFAFILLAACIAVPRANAATTWTVIVGGQTPDVSVYANGFYPREITIATGDTITWQFAGFHNVSFLSGAPSPVFAVKDGDKYYANPQVLFPAGNSTYDGTGFHNSGLPQEHKPFSYSLTFTKPGRYEYACTVHAGMTGIVNVVSGPVQETPAATLARGREEQAASLAAGTRAYQNLNPQTNSSHVTVTLVGSNQDRFSLLRFTHDPLVIARGTTVTWVMNDPFEIHTVTFADGDKLPALYLPQPQPNGPPKALLNPIALTPTKTTAYDGSGFVNSGFLYPARSAQDPPSSFSLTFTKPGRYVYWCLVHANEQQQGVVIVK